LQLPVPVAAVLTLNVVAFADTLALNAKTIVSRFLAFIGLSNSRSGCHSLSLSKEEGR
jgi:hypothetical protein